MPFLNNSSYSFIVLFYCLIGLSFTYFLYFIIRKFFPKFVVPSGDSDFMAGLHSALFTITFLTLGYSLANVAETVDKYQQAISSEANEIKKLDVLLSFYNSQESLVIRQDLRNYASSIVHDEWPQLERKQGSDVTLNYQRKIRENLQKINPITGKELIIYSDILQTSASIVQLRSTRILMSSEYLSPQFLFTSNMGYLGVLIISALMLTHFTWFRLIAITVQIVAVSFIFAATISLDNPFKGQDRISADPILKFSQSSINNF
jgi:hypothetical protein